jgi:hypothetical protein
MPSHFKVSFRLDNFNDHFTRKPTSVLRARAFATLFRTCAVPNKFRTRTQLRKIKPHFISLKFRVPKMEIRSSRHSHSAHLIVSLCMALSYEAWVRREFGVRFFPAAQLTVFHRGFSKCRPPASKQASHLLKIFLDTRLSFCLEMLAISFRLL